MTRHAHDNGQLVDRPVVHDHVVHHAEDDPGLLVVTGVPASVCEICDEHRFNEAVGFDLSRLPQEHEPGPGEVHTIGWVEAHAA